MILLFFSYRQEFESRYVHLSEVLLCMLPMLAHRIMLSLKYAVLSPEEYSRYMSEKDPAKAQQNQQHILIGYSFSPAAWRYDFIRAGLSMANFFAFS